jgi:hypothetical protein
MKLRAGFCVSCGKSISERFCCYVCKCSQFCSVTCAGIHLDVHCDRLFYRSFAYQVRNASCFIHSPKPPPGVMLDMVHFTDAIVASDQGEGKFCCDCNRSISSVGPRENVGLGLSPTGTFGFVAYLTCPKKECPRNTKHPCGVFFMCQNNPNTYWGYVAIKDATSAREKNYDMQVIYVKNDTPKIPAKSKVYLMTKRDKEPGKDGIHQITFVVIAKKKGDIRYAYSEKDNKWGTKYYKREWEFLFVDSH